MKTLLLHVPKFNNFYKPVGDFMWLNYMPMGLLAVADFANRHGLDVEVVHLGVEWVENREFQIKELIDNRPDIGAVGMSLHWHHQAYDVIEVARRLKEIRSDIFIFLGGDTASGPFCASLSRYATKRVWIKCRTLHGGRRTVSAKTN